MYNMTFYILYLIRKLCVLLCTIYSGPSCIVSNTPTRDTSVLNCIHLFAQLQPQSELVHEPKSALTLNALSISFCNEVPTGHPELILYPLSRYSSTHLDRSQRLPRNRKMRKQQGFNATRIRLYFPLCARIRAQFP